MEISNQIPHLELDELAQCVWFEDTTPYQDNMPFEELPAAGGCDTPPLLCEEFPSVRACNSPFIWEEPPSASGCNSAFLCEELPLLSEELPSAGGCNSLLLSEELPSAGGCNQQAVGRWALSKLPEKLAVDQNTHKVLQQYFEQLGGTPITKNLMREFAESSGIPFPQVSYWFKRRSVNVTYQPKRQHEIHHIHYMMDYYEHVTKTPTELEKDHIAVECGMSVSQVHNWFKDVRRRGFPIRSGKTTSECTAARPKYKRTKFGSKSRKSNAGAKAKKRRGSQD
jgi:hypothetical protein